MRYPLACVGQNMEERILFAAGRIGEYYIHNREQPGSYLKDKTTV